jgi:hypothetical protein
MSEIRSKPPTKEYEDGWDRIFGKKYEEDWTCKCGHRFSEHEAIGDRTFECHGNDNEKDGWCDCGWPESTR